MKRVLLLSCAALSLTSGVLAQSPEGEAIIGYKYSCSATLGDPQSRNAYLVGGSVLNERGVRTSYFTTYQPAWDDTDQAYFLGNRPDQKAKDQTHLRWSLSWRKFDNAHDPKGFNIAFDDATLLLDFSSWKTLPKQVVLLAGQSELGLTQYGKPLHAFAERHLGRKSGAGFAFDLRHIFATTGQKDMMGWTVFKTPLSANMPYTSIIGQGVIDLKPVRAVQKEFEQFAAILSSNEVDFQNKCKKSPVYDEEYDELSIS